MRILYIWDADYPWDVRVEKICRSLVARGHEVHIAARNLKRRPVEEVIGHLHIHRLPPRPGQSWNYAMSFPAFFSPVWRRFLAKIVRAHSIDVVIVRDLPMVIAGLWAARRHDIPVVFDNAEDYVAMIRAMWDRSGFKGLDLLVRNPVFAKYVERYALPKVDRTLVVSDEMIEVCRQAGADVRKVFVVGNTPVLASLARSSYPSHLDLSPLEGQGRWAGIYAGGLQTPRGLYLVLEGLPALVKEIPNFLFVVVGDGHDRLHLERMASELGVEAHVWFVGWVEHQNLAHYIRACDVGLIPHIVSAHVDTTIPNKIYDYMGCGVPVVASDARSMKRILETTGAGVVFRSGDSQDFVRAVLEVYHSNLDLGAHGMKAIVERLNWSVDEEVLIDVVEGVVEARSRS